MLTRAAEDEYAAKELAHASELAHMLLARQPPVDAGKQRIAWTIIAESQFSSGGYDQAEAAFLKARDLAGADAKQKSELSERLAADVYKQGEAKQQAGNGAGAVEDYLRVAKVAPDSKIRATAQYDAAAQLINLKQWDRAISVLEQFRRDFPKSELASQTPFPQLWERESSVGQLARLISLALRHPVAVETPAVRGPASQPRASLIA